MAEWREGATVGGGLGLEWRARRKEEGGVTLRVVDVDERKKIKGKPSNARRNRAGKGSKERLEVLKRAVVLVQTRQSTVEERAPGQELAAEGTLWNRVGGRDGKKGEKLRLTKLGMKVARALPRRRECEPSQDFQVAASPSQNGGGDPLWRNWPIKRRESVLVAGGWTGLRQAQIGVTFIRRSFTGALQRLDFFWPWLKVEDERELAKATTGSFHGHPFMPFSS